MPTYRVQTDQGTFRVELDAEPSSQEELMDIVNEQIGAAPQSTPKAPPKRQPEGFTETLKSEASEGFESIKSGVKRALMGQRAYDWPMGIGEAAIGGLQVMGAPQVATGRKAGETVQDIAMKLGAGPNMSAALATVADLGTQFVGIPAAAKGVAKGAMKMMRPTETTQRILALAERFGIPLSAGQATQSKMLSQIEGVPTRFPLGVQPVAKFSEKQAVASKLGAERISEALSPEKLSTKEAGELYKATLYPQASETARKSVGRAYDAVKTAIPENELFSTPGLIKKAEEVQREALLSKGVITSKGEAIAKEVKRALTPGGLSADLEAIGKVKPDLLDEIIAKYNLGNKDHLMTFEGMDFLRKDLREVLQKARKAGNDQEVRRVGMLIDGLTDDMRATAEKFPNAFGLLEQADKQFAQEVAPFFTKGKLPRKLSDNDASAIVKSYIWGNRDKPESIAIVKRALNQPDEFNKIVRSWWDDLIEKSINPQTEQFSTRRMITNYARFSDDVKKELLGATKQDADALIDLFSKMETSAVASVNPSETARGILGATQMLSGVQIAGKLVSGDLAGAIKQGVITLTPYGVAKVMTSPTGIKLLTRAFEIPPGTPEAVELGARIVGLANQGMNKTDFKDLLKSDVSIEDKISAALGNELN